MNRPRRLVALVAAGVALGGCGVSGELHARAARDETVPFALLDPSAAPLVPSSAGPGTQQVSLCFIRDGRLTPLVESLPGPVSLRALVSALATPPSDSGPLLRTALIDGAIVNAVRLAGGIAQVDMGQSISTVAADDQLLAVAQIVCTLTLRPGVGQVSFTLEGTPLAVPKGDGSLVTSPVARDDYASLGG